MTFRLIQHTSSTAANLLKSPISSPYSTSAIRRTLALNNQLTSSFSQTMSAKSITTAAALIIGDEVLNGKIKDTNSNYFAKFCFDNNIELKTSLLLLMTRPTLLRPCSVCPKVRFHHYYRRHWPHPR